MWQTLVWIPREIAGVPVLGWGWLLGLWLLVGAVSQAWLLWREGWTASAWSGLPVWLVFAAVIVWLLPRIAEPQGLPIRGYGTMVVLAVLAGTGLALRLARRERQDVEAVSTLAFWMFVCGILGARVLYVVEYWDEYRAATWPDTLANVLKLTEGGLVVYGSVLGAMAALLVITRIKRLSPWKMADIAAPAGALAMGLGRIGCFLNGCCYGGETAEFWGVQFPFGSPPYAHQARVGHVGLHGLYLAAFDGTASDANGPALISRVEPGSEAERAGLRGGQEIIAVGDLPVRNAQQAFAALVAVNRPGDPLHLRLSGVKQPVSWRLPASLPRSRPVHPTQLYSTWDGVVLCLVLLAYWPFRKCDGEVMALFLALYAVTRFLIEVLRDDEAALFRTGLTISQNLSVLLLLAALALWAYLHSRPRPREA